LQNTRAILNEAQQKRREGIQLRQNAPVFIKIITMANLTLVYGMRLLPSDEVAEVGEATVKLKSGRDAHVTMHVLEGSKEDIEKQLRTSLEAFFDFYPEI
jgi:hypothetical protein